MAFGLQFGAAFSAFLGFLFGVEGWGALLTFDPFPLSSTGDVCCCLVADFCCLSLEAVRWTVWSGKEVSNRQRTG